MKLALALVVFTALLGTCLSEPVAKPAPAPKAFPFALADAFAKAFPEPQGAVGDLLSGLSTLLQNLLAALLGGGMAAMMGGMGGGDGGMGGDGGSGGGGDCGGCGGCGCGCCIETCVPGFYSQLSAFGHGHYYG